MGCTIRDYRSKHHYNEPSGGGLVLIGLMGIGALVGIFIVPQFADIAAGRAGRAGILAGLVIWLLILAANR